MRMSRLFLRTLREDPADADVDSHRLLVRAGYIRKVAAGVYAWLPLGDRVLRNVSQIVREEMDAAGAQELNLPIYATRGTAEMLAEVGIACTAVEKSPGDGVSGLDVIRRGLVDLVINIPRKYDEHGRPDGYLIRREAIDQGVALVTDLPFARAIVEALRWRKPADLDVIAWNDLLEPSSA